MMSRFRHVALALLTNAFVLFLLSAGALAVVFHVSLEWFYRLIVPYVFVGIMLINKAVLKWYLDR